jgi:hypothetical protein
MKRTVIRALTLYQPWAWAVAAGKKTVENRSWRPWSWLLKDNVETWLAIHAGSTYEKEGERFLRERGVVLSQEGSRTKGAILGVGRLIGCVTKSEDPMFFGPYGWVLDNLRLLSAPIFIKGQMGLWELPPNLEGLLLTTIQSQPITELSDPRQLALFGGAP